MGVKIRGFFKKLGTKFGTADRLTAFLAAAVLCASLVTVVPAVASGPDVDSNIGGTELSIGRFSEIMSNAFNSTMSQALQYKGASNLYMNVVDKPADGMGIHTIGNFLGFPGGNDSAQDSGNVWTKGVDAASRVMTLESVAGFYGKGTKVDDLTDSNMAQYIVFGCALNSLGIDEFRDAQSASDGVRMITGYVAYICFILAYSASDIMGQVISIMNEFNIFTMFYNGGTRFLRNLVGTNSNLLNNIDSALNIMYDLRFIFLGLGLVFLVWTTMVWKSKAYSHAATMQEKWRKFFMRIAVVAIGVPVVGMTYTECLKLIDAAAARPKYNITNYVFQEFLDFESWAKGSSKSFYVGGSGADTNKFTVVYDANNQTFAIGKQGSDAFTIDEPLDASKFVYSINEGLLTTAITGSADDAIYVDTLYGTSGVGLGSQSYSDLLKVDTSGTVNKKAYTACRDLLLNYARSTTVSADTLNDYFLADLTDLAGKLVTTGSGVDANQAAAVNATAIEQLFGEDAANQRIWSYIKAPSDEWIYPKDADDRELILAETSGAQIVAKLSGIACVSGASGTSNGVDIGGLKIMKLTLNPSYRFQSGSGFASGLKISATGATENPSGNKSSPRYSYTYDLSQGGMSPLALYNYMHTKFENGQIIVYDPDSTTNAGISMMHYSVTTPYSGIPEIVQLLFIICMLFSVGIIGWVFGISLLMNTVVQTVKAIPIIFKILMGSLQGFVEGLLIVLSISAELAVTVLLYAWSIDIIDFLIKVIQRVVNVILGAFKSSGVVTGVTVDPESYAIMSGIISMLVILWGTFNLIKWRRAITLSIKSIITHVLNQVFGTSAAMPTGASSGMLKAGAGLAAGAMVAGALADQGTLDDVVNDLTDSDLGSSIHDKIADGDYEGAMQDIQDFASGNYEGGADRGRSETSEAEKALAAADERIGGAFGAAQQSMTDEQAEKWHDDWDDKLGDAEEALRAAQESGDEDAIEEADQNMQDTLNAAAADKAAMQAENAKKAAELGVADYGDYLRSQKDGAGNPAITGAKVPHKAQKNGKDAELDANAQMAYDAARDGDMQTLRTAADMYDENGLDAEQADAVNEAVLDGASEEQVASMIDGYAQENFGDDHDAITSKINEAAGRGNTATYGNSNPTDGRAARTMSVQGMHGESGDQQYGVTDNNTGDRHLMEVSGGQAHEVQGGFLPEEANTELSAQNQAAYDAVASGDTAAMAAAAQGYSVLGTDAAQTEVLNRMAANGASATEIAAAANNFAQDNFGDDYARVVSGMNKAAGRDGSQMQVSGIGSDGQVRAMGVAMDTAADGSVSYSVQDLGDGSKSGKTSTIDVSDAGGQSTYTQQGRGGEQIVTTDFGSGAGAAGSTYGEIRENMQTVANASGGMIKVGSGGGGSGQVTVSEATAAVAGGMAYQTSGQAADVRLGDVKGQSGVEQHMSAVQGVIDQGVPSMSGGGAQVGSVPTGVVGTAGTVGAAAAVYGASVLSGGGTVSMPSAGTQFVQQPAAQFVQSMPAAQPIQYQTAESQMAVQAVASGNVSQIQQAAQTYSALGTTQQQTAVLRSMAASGASSTEIAAAANNFAQANFGDGYAEVVTQMNAAAGRSGGSLSISGIGADGQMRTVDVGMQTDSGGNVSYRVKGAGGSKKSQTVEVEESGGQVIYKGSGESIVTQDFGSGGAQGTTYGEIRETIRSGNGAGVLLDQSGAGGGAGHITVSEAAAAFAAQAAMEQTGSATAAGQVRIGNVTSAQGMADHVAKVQQLLYGGQAGSGAPGEAGGQDIYGTAMNAAMVSRAYSQMQSFLNSGAEVDPNAINDESDGTSGNIYGNPDRG